MAEEDLDVLEGEVGPVERFDLVGGKVLDCFEGE
jgi:hypothetical protein